jgi:phage antirepressor YoqD-like protein
LSQSNWKEEFKEAVDEKSIDINNFCKIYGVTESNIRAWMDNDDYFSYFI